MLERVTQRYPFLTAAGLYTMVVAVAFGPAFQGRFLATRMSDQWTGYAFRDFAARFTETFGSIPQWSPYIFGGIPFVANTGHGDTFYPTFLLRLALPVDMGMALGFLIHIVLAGSFAFLFFRTIGLSWAAAFVGGAAYLLSGQIVSLVSPGHDGKLFVSALFPLALLFLHRAVASGAWRAYISFGVTVGFALLSPHVQMTYYLLMAAGFYWLYLVFLHEGKARPEPWWRSALLFAAGLATGFALSAVQLFPFAEYIQFSPRGSGGSSTGWEYAVSWSMPPEEFLGTLWPRFSGILDQYWGRNPFKLHSEYLGVATLVLATFAFVGKGGSRLRWFFLFLAAYGTAFAFGGYTPFYHLPYVLLPGIKLTRAPSMVFFLTAFAVAALAAMGTDRLLKGEGRKAPLVWWVAGMGLAALLAAAGGWQEIMRAVSSPDRFDAIAAAYGAFAWDTVRGLAVALLAASAIFALLRGRLGGPAFGLAMGALVLLDLWSTERHFIRFSPPAAQAFAADEVVAVLAADSSRFRVLPAGVYGDNYLMTHSIRSVLGYHGNELHRYDDLLGGKNEWRALGNPNVWKVLAVKYVAAQQPLAVQGLEPVLQGTVSAYERRPVYLYRVSAPAPFAYVVRDALKLSNELLLSTLHDPRFDPRRLLLVPEDAPAGRERISQLPDSVAIGVRVQEPRAGTLRLTLERPAPEPMYLFVSENYYPSWHARVDGIEAPVLRAQYALMAVPLRAGATEVELTFSSRAYALGQVVTLATALAIVAMLATARWRRKAV